MIAILNKHFRTAILGSLRDTVLPAHNNVHVLWLTMLLLTMTTYAMGKLDFSGVAAMSFLLLTAAVKATFIIRDFMELRGVSLLWHVIMYGWLVTVCASIAITYFISL